MDDADRLFLPADAHMIAAHGVARNPESGLAERGHWHRRVGHGSNRGTERGGGRLQECSSIHSPEWFEFSAVESSTVVLPFRSFRLSCATQRNSTASTYYPTLWEVRIAVQQLSEPSGPLFMKQRQYSPSA